MSNETVDPTQLSLELDEEHADAGPSDRLVPETELTVFADTKGEETSPYNPEEIEALNDVDFIPLRVAAQTRPKMSTIQRGYDVQSAAEMLRTVAAGGNLAKHYAEAARGRRRQSDVELHVRARLTRPLAHAQAQIHTLSGARKFLVGPERSPNEAMRYLQDPLQNYLNGVGALPEDRRQDYLPQAAIGKSAAEIIADDSNRVLALAVTESALTNAQKREAFFIHMTQAAMAMKTVENIVAGDSVSLDPVAVEDDEVTIEEVNPTTQPPRFPTNPQEYADYARRIDQELARRADNANFPKRRGR